jgi:hypothetical protein
VVNSDVDLKFVQRFECRFILSLFVLTTMRESANERFADDGFFCWVFLSVFLPLRKEREKADRRRLSVLFLGSIDGKTISYHNTFFFSLGFSFESKAALIASFESGWIRFWRFRRL